MQVVAVFDAFYGQQQGAPAVITAAGQGFRLPVSALTPVGVTTDHLMVISQDQLYALAADPTHTTDQLIAAPVAATVGHSLPRPGFWKGLCDD